MHASCAVGGNAGGSQARGEKLTYNRLKKYLIEPNHSDLALCISEGSNIQNMGKDAKYVFTIPEYKNHINGLLKELEHT